MLKPFKTTAILAAFTALGSQGCAIGATSTDCEGLSRSQIQQLEVELETTDGSALTNVQLCVTADNYDGCDPLEQTDKSNTYAVTYSNELTNVVSVYLQLTAAEPVSANASPVTTDSKFAAMKEAYGDQPFATGPADGANETALQPNVSVAGKAAVKTTQPWAEVSPINTQSVAVIGITDDGRELVFTMEAARPESNEVYAMAPSGSHETKQTEQELQLVSCRR